jgi:hypothetical protein
VNLIEFSATHYALFSIVYTQPYNEARRKRLFQAIYDCTQGLKLDDERTQWFGHSGGAYGAFAGSEANVKTAAARLEDTLSRMKIAKLVTRAELDAVKAQRIKQVNKL